jgi:hypothetical protein
MDVMYQNGWKMIDIFIHVDNIKYYKMQAKTLGT